MRPWTLVIAGSLALAACSRDEGPDPDDTDTTDTDAEGDGYPSSFTSGKFRMTQFVLLPVDSGADQDGDGTLDNNLPKLLDFADIAIGGELSPAEINTIIADNIGTGALNILLDANHADLRLSVAVLGAIVDPETGLLAIDPRSVDGQGAPTSVLTGAFTTETEFAATSDRIDVPATFVPGEEPLLVPIVQARLSGTLTAEGATGLLVGIAPAEDLKNQVIDPLIPEEGYDQDGDGDIDLTKAEILEMLDSIVNNENMSDWIFDDGTRGVTAAFEWEAIPATW